jgi:hypothetical protein
MSKTYDFSKLDADLEGTNKVEREKTTILFAIELKEAVEAAYGKGRLGSVLEAGALMKLRRDGHVPEKPKGAEPAGMNNYVEAKKEKVALEEIKDRVEKSGAKKPA